MKQLTEIGFKGRKYEVSASLIGATVEIEYDPMDIDTITVYYQGIEPFKAHPPVIGEFCDPKPEIPQCMLPEPPDSSRFLQRFARKKEKSSQLVANAISFTDYRKEDRSNV